MYVRTLSGSENCALCLVASTQLYHDNLLMPIHPGCDCGVDPVPDGWNGEQRLDEVKSALEDADMDFNSVDDMRNLIIVREHGEFGPTLSWRTHKFTKNKPESGSITLDDFAGDAGPVDWDSLRPREVPLGRPPKMLPGGTMEPSVMQSSFDNALDAVGEGPLPGLTAKQVDSLEMYTGPDYVQINQILRRGKHGRPVGITDEWYEKARATYLQEIEDIKSIFDHVEPTKKPMVLLRGVSRKFPDKMLGTTYTDKGFGSTTLSASTSRGFYAKTPTVKHAVEFEIRVPAGTKVLPVHRVHHTGETGEALKRTLNRTESEIILPPGTKFRVIKDTPAVRDGIFLDTPRRIVLELIRDD